MAEKKSPHAGHRERMRERLLSAPPSSFAEHEILEMLLFHTIPRGDTNETAHALIEAFGSLEGVLEADPTRLETVWGIGKSSTVLLSLVGETARRYTAKKLSREPQPRGALDSPEKAAEFLAKRFIGATKEMAYALLLDNGMRPLDCFPVGSGSVSSVAVSVRAIAERAYTKHAAAVILAHNHPGGLSIPSSDDIKSTHSIKEALALLEIPLVEHFVFSDRSYTPILNPMPQGGGELLAASSVYDTIQTNFQKRKETVHE